MAKKFENSKKFWMGEIEAKVAKSNKVALEALRMVYARQTADEQVASRDITPNGLGFTRQDAKDLTPLARKLTEGKNLSPIQLNLVRARLSRYGRQLFQYWVESGKLVEQNKYFVPADSVAPALPEASTEIAPVAVEA